MFLIASLVLLLLAALFVLVPLLRYRDQPIIGQQERDAANLQIFQERQAELQAELDAGEIDQAQFDMLSVELGRSVLSDVSSDLGTAGASNSGAAQKKAQEAVSWLAPLRLIPLLMILVVAPLSYYLYSLWGFEEDLKVATLFERSRDADDPAEIRDLIFELGAVLERDPENGWAAYFLARHLITFGQMGEAARFFERAARYIEHPQDRAIVLGQFAQAEYIASGQQMTERVQDIIAQAQRLNPAEPSVLQLLGANAFVNEDYQGAITYWQRLLSMGPDREEAEFLRAFIAQAQQMLGSSTESSPVDVAGPRVEVSLSLSPNAELPLDTRVFVSVQNPEQPGPPLAAKLLSVGDLPLVVSLSDADAVGPFNLSTATSVVVVATASVSGTADVQSGDWQARSDTLPIGSSQEPVRIQMQIRDVVP